MDFKGFKILGVAILLIAGSVGAATLIRALYFGQAIEAEPEKTDLAYSGEAAFVGRQACIDCHANEHTQWQGSHHDLAMQEATDATVLGDFDNATFNHFGITSTFFKRDGAFFVNTDGPDGAMQDFEIAYTFGVEPLQQYLIAMPGGRYQCLSITWDSRPAEAGGQRWYHLHPDEAVPAGDELHWTRSSQNWNHMCAECHSTDLQKNYDAESRTFDTTWSEINVSCEACHGPGSHHIQWANWDNDSAREDDPTLGLQVQFKDPEQSWIMNTETGIAERYRPLENSTVMDACARCHSRRGQITEHYAYGESILDTHSVSMLEAGLYFPDGQILDEVYVYGSFAQSKMHHAGVTCTDCHDPHTAQTYATGNALCAKCHLPERFDTPEHHHHAVGSTGASCVACHMPHRTYMGVDDRRDHSLRIPRPDLSLALGTPNACSQCHNDQTDQWAADAVVAWYGPREDDPPHYGQIFAAARAGQARADVWLAWLINHEDQTAIVKATAVSLLASYASAEARSAIRASLEHSDPMVRSAAVQTYAGKPAAISLPLMLKMLDDPVLGVRLQAGWVLSLLPTSTYADRPDTDKQHISQGIEVYVTSRMVSADKTMTHMQMGVEVFNLLMAEVRTEAVNRNSEAFAHRIALAESHFREAIQIEPSFIEPYQYLNAILLDTKRGDEAIELLDRAIARFEATAEDHPDDFAARRALALLNHFAGNGQAAMAHAMHLRAVRPDDPAVDQLINQLRP